MRKPLLSLFAVSLCLGLNASPALAQMGPPGGPDRHRPRPVAHEEPRWHGDIHHFREYDMDHWRGGRWYHGPHDGRDGWWWIVAGLWYFYATPVYPYPDPYTPPTVVVETMPGVTAYWYCADPAGYYPYVAQCFSPWQKVVAQSAAVVAPPAPTVVAPAVQPPVLASPPSVPGMLTERQKDDRQLNAFAFEMTNIQGSPGHVRKELKDLKERVEAFRQGLYNRSYNAMDILRDAENLEHRIDDQIAHVPPGKRR